jgi:AAA+ superfamily predicted ATPase
LLDQFTGQQLAHGQFARKRYVEPSAVSMIGPLASASEFIEVIVGVGPAASGMFTEARKVAPAIIFIDKIDTIGCARAARERLETWTSASRR